MAFPDDLTVFEFIDDCPAGRDLEQEIDDLDSRVSDIEDQIDDLDGGGSRGTKIFV